MNFTSPSRGSLTLDETYAEVTTYIDEKPKEQYKLIIGTDSQPHYQKDVCFVTAIIIHRVGKGARYFYRKQNHRYMESLRQRIYYETFLSLEVATLITAKLAENGHSRLNIEIHLDVGEVGETKELIREVVGMVIGSGFQACIKPDSYGATKVADKYTK
ncbi:MAG: ribonuclease H-like YkuK family protein [Bacillota bacterium]|nr:ribonuclease H-like YkuK family protein [Bacillota bacterium]MDW7684698.1 ribonuclease H-like YkuK family protein [Bacillota bacterium]